MALFVLASKDGWVNIMYTGLDAVGVDQQVIHGYQLIILTILQNVGLYQVSILGIFN